MYVCMCVYVCVSIQSVLKAQNLVLAAILTAGFCAENTKNDTKGAPKSARHK